MTGMSSLPWTADQQRLLLAMGYELFLRSPPTRAPAAIPTPDKAVPSAPVVEAHGRAEADPARRERLWAALRRAAGGRDVAGLVPDIEALRRDPALKRALWPRLRILRRGTAP